MKFVIDKNLIMGFHGEYRFLSNFYPCKITCVSSGLVYPSSEHYYQAMKTDSIEKRKHLATNVDTAGKAKKYGSKLDLPVNWDLIKYQKMLYVVRQKFNQNQELLEKLFETGDSYLVEGNTWGDTYWGYDLRFGTGLNKLGNILMHIRDHLRGYYYNV